MAAAQRVAGAVAPGVSIQTPATGLEGKLYAKLAPRPSPVLRLINALAEAKPSNCPSALAVPSGMAARALLYCEFRKADWSGSRYASMRYAASTAAASAEAPAG